MDEVHGLSAEEEMDRLKKEEHELAKEKRNLTFDEVEPMGFVQEDDQATEITVQDQTEE